MARFVGLPFGPISQSMGRPVLRSVHPNEAIRG